MSKPSPPVEGEVYSKPGEVESDLKLNLVKNILENVHKHNLKKGAEKYKCVSFSALKIHSHFSVTGKQ